MASHFTPFSVKSSSLVIMMAAPAWTPRPPNRGKLDENLTDHSPNHSQQSSSHLNGQRNNQSSPTGVKQWLLYKPIK